MNNSFKNTLCKKRICNRIVQYFIHKVHDIAKFSSKAESNKVCIITSHLIPAIDENVMCQTKASCVVFDKVTQSRSTKVKW